MEKLDEKEIQKQLAALNVGLDQPWQIKDQKLHKTFLFKNFAQAFGLMSKVATYAEQVDHHPEWFNVYNRLAIDLITHDIGGVSKKDFLLAHEIEHCFKTSVL